VFARKVDATGGLAHCLNRDESVPAKDEADEKFPRYNNRNLIRCPLTYMNRRRPNSDEAFVTIAHHRARKSTLYAQT
jgi:hypothetical protein